MLEHFYIRYDEGMGFFLRSISINPGEYNVDFCVERSDALKFDSWEEAASFITFIVYHLDSQYEGEFSIYG